MQSDRRTGAGVYMVRQCALSDKNIGKRQQEEEKRKSKEEKLHFV